MAYRFGLFGKFRPEVDNTSMDNIEPEVMSSLFGIPTKIIPSLELSHLQMIIFGQAVKQNAVRKYDIVKTKIESSENVKVLSNTAVETKKEVKNVKEVKKEIKIKHDQIKNYKHKRLEKAQDFKAESKDLKLKTAMKSLGFNSEERNTINKSIKEIKKENNTQNNKIKKENNTQNNKIKKENNTQIIKNKQIENHNAIQVNNAQNIVSKNENSVEEMKLKLMRLKSLFSESKTNKQGAARSNKSKVQPVSDNKKKLSNDNSEKCKNNKQLSSNNTKSTIKKSSKQYFENLVKPTWSNENFHSASEQQVKSVADISAIVKSVLEWKFVAVDSKNSTSRTMYMSRGLFDVLMYNKATNSWESTSNNKLKLPAETVVYGETVTEFNGERNDVTSKQCFHIIDAIVLGGKDVRELPLKDRHIECSLFAASIAKSATENAMTIRCKQLFQLTEVDIFFSSLSKHKMENNLKMLGINVNKYEKNKNIEFFVPSGILFLNENKSHKMKCFSTTHQKVYYFDKNSQKSQFKEDEKPEDIFASFKDTYTSHFVWNFEVQEQISRSHPKHKLNNLLYRDDLMKFISNGLKLFNIV